MKIKKSQLDELIRMITHQILKEYSSISSDKNEDDSEERPIGGKTDFEKKKEERDAEKDRLDKIRGSTLKLQGTKKQSDYFKQQLKQNKLAINAQTRELQNLKANKEVAKGGAGSIPPP
jgi:hypothetical protein